MVRRLAEAATPAAGAAVMGTGIVSVDLALDGRRVVSDLLLAHFVAAGAVRRVPLRGS